MNTFLLKILQIERLTKRVDGLGLKESKNNARNIDIIADKKYRARQKTK